MWKMREKGKRPIQEGVEGWGVGQGQNPPFSFCPISVGNALSIAGKSMTNSERPSPEPFQKKEASKAVLRGREFWKCSGSLKCVDWRIPAVVSRGKTQERSESVSGVFPDIFRIFS